MRHRWFRRPEVADIPLFEGDGPVDPEWPEVNPEPEPEPGPFDFPHRIRSREQLEAEAAVPLPDDAAGRALRHRAESAQARREAPPEVSIFDGIEIAEEHNPYMQQMVTQHEDSMRQAAILARWDAIKGTRTFAVALKIIDGTEKARKKIEALRSR